MTDLKPLRTPGSPAAKAEGCTCAVIDNHRGHGKPHEDGVPRYWVTRGCPLHWCELTEAEENCYVTFVDAETGGVT